MNRWLRLIFADWQLKLLGLGIAVALWAYVHSLRSVDLTLTVPLELRNMPRASRLARKPPPSVEVRFEASVESVHQLTPRTVKAVVDMRNLVKGRYVTVPLNPDHILRPEGVGVIGINPSQLNLEFDSTGRHEEE